ncbi:uncharacterized protein LOC144625740 [Crassostrea virginica]
MVPLVKDNSPFGMQKTVSLDFDEDYARTNLVDTCLFTVRRRFSQLECSIDKLAENGCHDKTDSESSQRAAQSRQIDLKALDLAKKLQKTMLRKARGSDDRCNRRQERNKKKRKRKTELHQYIRWWQNSRIVGMNGSDDVTYSSDENGSGSDRMAGGVQAYCHDQGGEA